MTIAERIQAIRRRRAARIAHKRRVQAIRDRQERRTTRRLEAPPWLVFGTPTIEVESGRWRYVGQDWRMSSNPLQGALQHAVRGDQVQLADGTYPHLAVGAATGPLFDVVVKAAPGARPRIGGIHFAEIHGVPTWDDVYFEGVDLFQSSAWTAAFWVHDTTMVQGRVGLRDFKIEGGPGAWEGYKFSFGIKGTGQCSWDIRHGTIEAQQYHGVYVDNADGQRQLSYFGDLEIERGLRTGFQKVNRTYRSFYGPPLPGFGDCLMERIHVFGGHGTTAEGSAITLKGQLGTDWVRDCSVDGGLGGALVVHTEGPQHDTPPGRPDVWLDDAGFTTSRFVLENFSADMPAATRKCVAVKGCGEVEFLGSLDVGSDAGALVSLDSAYDGWIPNGIVRDPSGLLLPYAEHGRLHIEDTVTTASQLREYLSD